MAGKQRVVTPQQAIILNEIRDTNATYKGGKAQVAERIRREVAAEMMRIELELAVAIRRARDAGVAKAEIGRALGTSDPRTVTTWLDRTDKMVRAADPLGVFTWHDRDAHMVRVQFANFPTQYPNEDYPDVLSGIVQKVERSKEDRNGWHVVSDDSDRETANGVLPGLLRWEIRDVPLTDPTSLSALLNAWVATQ